MTTEQLKEVLEQGEDESRKLTDALCANDRLLSIAHLLETMRLAGLAVDGLKERGDNDGAEQMQYVVDTYQEVLQHVMLGNIQKAREVAGQ